MEEKVYGVCKYCGNYCYRKPGYRHGDGRIDSDDNPVWLLDFESEMTKQQISSANTNLIDCGCGG
jgi:hypothetical protein